MKRQTEINQARIKKPWQKPRITRLGDFRTFVQTGGIKSGPQQEGTGGGGGEEPMMATGGGGGADAF